MIACVKCSTSNSLDSTYCRKCGAEISEIDVQEARVRLESMIAEGNHAFNENRTDDALAISESVLASDANHSPALWLKAMCHERRNEIPLALECADRIVELNPDSELDKIRRTQLRNKLTASLTVVELPDRRMAVVGAVAASVLVVCIGLLTANLMQARNAPDRLVVSNETPGNTLLTQDVAAPASAGETQTQILGNPAGQTIQANSQAGQPGPGDVPALGRQNTATRTQPNNQPSLPQANIGGTLPVASGTNALVPENIEVRPVQPPVLPGTSSSTKPPRNEDPTETFAVDESSQEAQTDPGQIEISVYNGGKTPTPTGPATTSNSSNGVEARTRTALQAFQLGNYAQAANLLEQAIRGGGDPVRLNQRLGQAFERLGRSGEAIEAYRRSVQAGEAALAQGKANPAGIRAAVESSQQALKKLGG